MKDGKVVDKKRSDHLPSVLGDLATGSRIDRFGRDSVRLLVCGKIFG